jgi:putative ABC transport system permease protein
MLTVQLLSTLDNALNQGMGYGVAVVGVALAFRVLRYPDLTIDGSFLMGATVFAALSVDGQGWPLATLAAIGGGAAAGLVTAILHTRAGVNRLLSGILTTMMCYSVSFRVLSGRSNVALAGQRTMFSTAESLDASAIWAAVGIHPVALAESAIIAGLIIAGVYLLLKSDLGLVLRASGENRSLVESLGRRPQRYCTIGLALSNGLVGLSGCLIAARQGFADVGMGLGVVITLIASLVIGEELTRLLGCDAARNLAGRTLSGMLGACGYFFLYLLILRASILGWIPIRIQPTDLKLLSALIVVGFIVLRNRSHRGGGQPEEVLPI